MTPAETANEKPSYSPTQVAGGYSAATGVGAGFSLAAVVLVFTITATNGASEHRYDLAFAACAFTVGTVGLLFCSFSYANLSGAKPTQAAFLHLMLNSAGLTLCFLAELSGFEALARAYLSDTAAFFVIIIVASIVLSPLWTWMVQIDLLNEDPSRTKHRLRPKWAIAVFLTISCVAGGGVAVVALVVRGSSVGSSNAQGYVPLALALLAYIGLMAFSGAFVSSRTNGKVSKPWLILPAVAVGYLGLAGYLVLFLP